MVNRSFRFAIDRGGTFTDVWAKCPSGNIHISKLLSDDETQYTDAPTEGIRRILEKEGVSDFFIGGVIDGDHIEWIRMGTTVATNALLENRGEPIALLITKGFGDLLAIGDQSRKNLFNLNIDEPYILHEEIIEVDERIILKRQDCHLTTMFPAVITKSGEKIIIWRHLNQEEVKSSLKRIFSKGIRSLAIALLHSYLYDEHEKMIEKLAIEMGFENVVLSSNSSRMVKIVPRASNTCVDAYLNSTLREYISSFKSGFKNLPMNKILLMQSNGDMTSLEKFTGSRAIMSGPAGGVIGYALTTFTNVNKAPLIGFDMGGTSTDISRFSGNFEETIESSVGGVKLMIPHLDIQTVAAGGGSKLSFHCGIFYVGPDSAGANPGPTCYRKGGPLTITDANLILGRVLPVYFPKVFGESRNLPLDFESSYKAFALLTDKINNFAAIHGGKIMTIEEVAVGFIKVANETMCRPIRALTEAKGYDTSQHVLCCFGGAGGQHACSIAKSLGIKTIYIHKYSGILSAFGIALADVSTEKQEPCSTIFIPDNYGTLDRLVNDLKRQCVDELRLKGFQMDSIEAEVFLHMRYEGTDFAIICSGGKEKAQYLQTDFRHFEDCFVNKFSQEFGFNMNKNVVVETLRVKAYGKSDIELNIPHRLHAKMLSPKTVAKVFFDEEFVDTPVYDFNDIPIGHILCGPSIVIDCNSTIVVEPGCKAYITSNGDLEIKVNPSEKQETDAELNAAQLSVFSHRFMSIAEQMGRVLQRTALSVNIKERLDFSCALFGPDGGLVANAPHIPVHLGAMQKAVQFQIEALGDNLKDGDVILSNHPCAGGSHLPDLTVITPVFHSDIPKPVFYVACRGHHADIGGSTPGSMPADSKTIFDEGALFMSFFLVKRGWFNEAGLIEAFKEPGKHPNCSGSRNIKDNICDLQAQIAANKKGIFLVQELINEHGLDFVLAYMNHIQFTAAKAVQHMLKEVAFSKHAGSSEIILIAEDTLDEGFNIKLTVTINPEGLAIFDFSGTSNEIYGNLNAPEAITYSAIIYCLRCMIKQDIPLNQGCLRPITVIIPKGSILSPSENAAVVGGNVLTSQRIVDVIFKAFEVCAASQGCMNNVTFGDDTMGYYETVGGGSGAGPHWHGRSGVHTHMTNTRITDVEVLEKRYPVIVLSFSINKGSGGKGRFDGGNGIIREILFRKPLILSVLSERRVFSPYGMKGGCPGQRGSNILKRDGRIINLGAKFTLAVKAGDVFCLMTPGGGGYGAREEKL